MCESDEMGSFGWKQKLFLPFLRKPLKWFSIFLSSTSPESGPCIKVHDRLLQSQTLPAFWAWRRPERKHEFSKSMFFGCDALAIAVILVGRGTRCGQVTA